jgi:uncharacterized protein YbjT (DUF2867 family)
MHGGTKIAVTGATGRVGRHVVDVLREDGHDVVRISRSDGVDVITADGLAAALEGVESVIDTATSPSPDEAEATEFFTTSARNLQELAERAGVKQIVVVSIIGIERFNGGYGAAKIVQEQAMLAGPVPARILRASQFHEFIPQLVEWGRRRYVSYVPVMRTQPVAARTVAEALVAMAYEPSVLEPGALIPEIAGPREERLADLARLYTARSGVPVHIEEASNPADPTHEAYEKGWLLPGPDAMLAGPTFAEWLEGVPEQATPHAA